MNDECDSTARVGRHGRLPALEGLRGLAALVVVVHHSLLATVPRFAGAYGVGPYPLRGTPGWWLTYSPLHLLWGGGESVVVFFVLSGFVLSLPSARGRGVPRPLSYYPSRFVRLYLPVWGALSFAALMHVLVIGSAARATGGDWWLSSFSEPLSLQAAREDAGLLSTHTGHWALLGVLWSLRWEVLFSLALPLLLLLAVRGLRTRLSWALLVSACAAALLWHGSSEYLLELPPFVLGVALAFHHEDIARLARALARRTWWSAAARLLLGAACMCALSADWWLVRSAPEGQTAMSGTAALLVAVGACLAVLAALTLGSFETFLRSRPIAWTGRRSYSLYLVHCPIVVALALAAGGSFSLGYLIAALALSLAAAAVFHRVVEAPAHRFSRRIAHATRGAADTQSGAPQLRPAVTSAGTP
ncbi:MAG TPA: acyltransferase [Solirubrobacteraceae bacterium]|jgi:peptidoglycan/LPS O-acetylase OafA/YrhL|nr:acyltransferase [Solirubrobacteraceae bacterium]